MKNSRKKNAKFELKKITISRIDNLNLIKGKGETDNQTVIVNQSHGLDCIG